MERPTNLSNDVFFVCFIDIIVRNDGMNICFNLLRKLIKHSIVYRIHFRCPRLNELLSLSNGRRLERDKVREQNASNWTDRVWFSNTRSKSNANGHQIKSNWNRTEVSSKDTHRPKHVSQTNSMHSNTMTNDSVGLFYIPSRTSAIQNAKYWIPKSKPAVIAICYALQWFQFEKPFQQWQCKE